MTTGDIQNLPIGGPILQEKKKKICLFKLKKIDITISTYIICYIHSKIHPKYNNSPIVIVFYLIYAQTIVGCIK